MTIEQGQEFRKKGMYMVADKKMSKVIGVFHDLSEAEAAAGKTDKILKPLRVWKISKEEIAEALQELALGLQCSRSLGKVM